MSKRPLNERLDELYEVLLSGTNSVSGYDRLVSASAVEEVRAINAELFAALECIARHQEMIGGNMPSATRLIAENAIAKAVDTQARSG